MKLRVGSDLHLEWRLPFKENPDEALPKVLETVLPEDERDFESVLVLAGDITSYPAQRLALLKRVVPRFKHVFYVAGNHEFWGSDMMAWVTERKLMLDTFGDKLTVSKIGGAVRWFDSSTGVSIIGATKWTAFGRGSPRIEMCLQRFPDCFSINYNSQPLTPKKIAAIHQEEIAAIIAELKSVREKSVDTNIVVVTHHLPSFSLCDPRYAGGIDGFDHAFASNQNNLLGDDFLAPDFWIHGHTHVAVERFLGNSHILCNPAGYPNEQPGGYRPHCFIEV